METVLIVDDEAVVRTGIGRIVSRMGLEAEEAANGKDAIEKMSSRKYDVVFLDIRMEGVGGLEVLEWVSSHHCLSLVVMITGITEPEMVIQCMKMGAWDYLVKPFGADDIEKIIRQAQQELCPETLQVRAENCLPAGPDKVLLGSSVPMCRLFSTILKVAPTDSTVLITGESGTGKELVARSIHYHSKRRHGDFVPVDCSALVENLLESELFGHVKGSFTGAIQTKKGLFELADNGTFFFDEIANLSMDIQAKLLRVIQERDFTQVGGQVRIKVDIRIIVATNKDLQTAMAQNRFREDLFYRLHVIPIYIPPLRDRKEDIPLLVDSFLRLMGSKLNRKPPKIAKKALEILGEYEWAGNVRELENTVERIMILEDVDVIRPEHLPPYIRQRRPDFDAFPRELVSLKDLEKQYIRYVLDKAGGGIQKAAGILGINRKTLSMKIKKYKL